MRQRPGAGPSLIPFPAVPDSKNAPRLHELKALLQERSIAKGDFVLTSGARSHYYCDTKATVLSPRGARG